MIKRPRYGSYHVGRHACSSDLLLIDGDFATHMRERGYSSSAIARYRYYLVRVAGWLATHRRRLTSLSRKQLPRLARLMVPKPTYHTLLGVLNRWLKFRQRYTVEPCESWAHWLNNPNSAMFSKRLLQRAAVVSGSHQIVPRGPYRIP